MGASVVRVARHWQAQILARRPTARLGCAILPQGAERRVRVPDELQRFAALPMTVESCTEEDKVVTRVLAFVELDASAGTTRWRLANVRVNRRSGRGLSVRQRKETFDIPLTALRRVNLHLDC